MSLMLQPDQCFIRLLTRISSGSGNVTSGYKNFSVQHLLDIILDLRLYSCLALVEPTCSTHSAWANDDMQLTEKCCTNLVHYRDWKAAYRHTCTLSVYTVDKCDIVAKSCISSILVKKIRCMWSMWSMLTAGEVGPRLKAHLNRLAL